MSTSAASLALPTLTLRTRQPLCSPQCFSSSLSLNPNSKRFSISAAFLRPTLSLSSRFVSHVALSSEFDQEEDTFSGDERPNYSPDLKLFVGNLPFSCDSAQLAELFESAGNVEMVEVIYDKTTGRSRGFGFVTMSSADEVEAAAQQFNGYELDGRQLRVNSGPPPARNENFRNDNFRNDNFRNDNFRNENFRNDNFRNDNFRSRGGPPSRGGGPSSDSEHRVHVGNLAWGVDHFALESLFAEQGKVLEAKVIYDRESGRSRGFGFVTYGSSEEVNSAIQSLDGADLNGRAIRVSAADAKPKRQF
ncbi:29 kDa ribonucleoprotein A, chloroplastic [Gastrolobium bilobum]|uniref:29 kDa ribonucleoprotein A, chloroplastic n=1 Tax=Gastrolobium bilobum TaxID=150636 RepID=UPI002AB097AC|nr:29 kDa ribonucleoprotein A, chloroplastic [Gastrolobium bilobum]